MTSPNEGRFATRMLVAMMAGSVIVVGGLLPGCGKKEVVVQAPPPPPPPPPPPAAPKVTSIADLMVEYNIDPRISMEEAQAPDTNEERIAVLVFFDAMTRGDSAALKERLPYADQEELDLMVESGTWEDSTGDAIDRIEIRTGKAPMGDDAALALITTGLELQPQLWYFASSDGDAFTFEAAPTPPDILDKLSGTDWIAAWHAVIDAEMAKADLPDEMFEVPSVDVSDQPEETPSTMPMGPGGGGRRKTPPVPTVPAPNPGGPGGPSPR